MGIDIVKLNAERNTTKPRINPADFAQPTFKTFHVPSPAMSIWLMTLPGSQPIFPWWNYSPALDEDLAALGKDWNIPSQQGLFDCLTLSHLAKFGGNNLFAILPGCIKTTGWGALRQADRETFTRGQGCVYHLFGNYDTKLNVNWVPFWEPQSLVRNPNFGSLWRLFTSNTGDETSRCLTLFSVSNTRKIPEISNLLINKDNDRSAKLVSLVDWFAVYTSPLDPKMGTCAAIYTQNKDVIEKLSYLQAVLASQIAQAQQDLLLETLPRTALRIMSRQVSL